MNVNIPQKGLHKDVVVSAAPPRSRWRRIAVYLVVLIGVGAAL